MRSLKASLASADDVCQLEIFHCEMSKLGSEELNQVGLSAAGNNLLTAFESVAHPFVNRFRIVFFDFSRCLQMVCKDGLSFAEF